MRKLPIASAVLLTASMFATLAPGSGAGATGEQEEAAAGEATTYVVLAEEGQDLSAAMAAAETAGGTVTDANAAVGMVTVRSERPDFARVVSADERVEGVARDSVVGTAPAVDRTDDVEQLTEAERAAAVAQPAPAAAAGTEPLSPLQWDMDMINAPEAHATQVGDHRTKVGIIDTGVDGSHPDIAPNFNAALSRNFTTDIPLVDGPCEDDPDGSCEDPADVDENGHGTHVAGTIGSPVNGVGIAGVAPGVELVNLRAGQDSGYFFLAPTVDALTYAADNGIDVVNMSFYIDPWLFNCTDNPADTVEEQYEQRTIIAATQRALDYATANGVTLIAAEGNGHTDLGNPTFDGSSPDFPPGEAHDREIDNACLNLPTEGNGVVGVTSVGPSGRKAYYSDYGVEQADVSAPGGDAYDGSTTPDPSAMILAPYPEAIGLAAGEIDPETGESLTPFVVADCGSGDCSYYQFIQGTSMASPHAAGVAALIVAEKGHPAGPLGWGLEPSSVVRILTRSAADTPCPNGDGGLYEYPAPIPAQYDAVCEGTSARNGFYGDGIIDAAAAVNSKGRSGRV